MRRDVASALLWGVHDKLPDVELWEKHYGHELYFSLNGKTMRIGEIFYDDDGNRCGGIGPKMDEVPDLISELVGELGGSG